MGTSRERSGRVWRYGGTGALMQMHAIGPALGKGVGCFGGGASATAHRARAHWAWMHGIGSTDKGAPGKGWWHTSKMLGCVSLHAYGQGRMFLPRSMGAWTPAGCSCLTQSRPAAPHPAFCPVAGGTLGSPHPDLQVSVDDLKVTGLGFSHTPATGLRERSSDIGFMLHPAAMSAATDRIADGRGRPELGSKKRRFCSHGCSVCGGRCVKFWEELVVGTHPLQSGGLGSGVNPSSGVNPRNQQEEVRDAYRDMNDSERLQETLRKRGTSTRESNERQGGRDALPPEPATGTGMCRVS
eukprot:353143-Chlamydomonas_euryale.AAC.2